MNIGDEKKPLDSLEEQVELMGVSPALPPWSVGDVVQDSEHHRSYRIQRVLTLRNWSLPYRFYEVIEIVESDSALKGEVLESSVDVSRGKVEAERFYKVVEMIDGVDNSSKGEVLELYANTSEEKKETSPLWAKDTPSDTTIYWLWEATSPETISSLDREAAVLAKLDLPMLPKVYAHFKQNERSFLVTEALPEQTLAEAMERNELSFYQFLGVLAQVSYALIKVHENGWAHLGLRPQSILVGKPIKLVDFRWARQIGDKLSTPFYLPGYSPPELFREGEVIDGREDIFAVGALLYYAVNGKPIPEVGVQWAEWKRVYPGVPQILSRCLGPKEERYPKMEDLHRDLLKLRDRYAPSITYDVASATTIGLEPSRTTNQDSYGYLNGRLQGETGGEGWLLVCVADGMGGMEAGEAASEIAVRTVMTEASLFLTTAHINFPAEQQAQLLKDWVQKANNQVYTILEQKRVHGGTTLLCALLIGKRLAIAHVGDSRLYLVRGEEIQLLTRDHSLAMALALKEGTVDMEALRRSPDRSRLTRSLGERSLLPTYFIDTLEATTGKATIELQVGDILMLCSDGLWEPVTESEMQSILQLYRGDLYRAAQELLALSLQRGGSDNATVLLVEIKEKPPMF